VLCLAYAQREAAIAALYDRALFAEEEAHYADAYGEAEAAEYWRIQADHAEREARRLRRRG
jgi:hypothetical protein